MNTLHENATITAKGQITIPKSIRQALGVNYGDILSFKMQGSHVIVSKDDQTHDDPAIGKFLSLIEKDISNGKNLTDLPAQLKQKMLDTLSVQTDINEEITGEVEL